MAFIEINDVRKSYGTTEVVKGVSLSINSEEFLVLVGPSGCGKSTLLRMIAGLEEISSGTISIDGRVINHIPPKDRDIAMVFQNYALYPHMSVYENLAFGLKMRGMKKKDYHELILQTAETLGLSALLNRKPKQLSGGQKQRIAVGRAIVRNPKAFLFDEPLSNLDAKLRGKMRTDLLKIHKQQKATSIYVTHDQVEAMTMADRVAVLNGGIIQQIGTPLEVYSNPANLFVAGFIGSPTMNFLKGEITSNNGAPVFKDLKGNTLLFLPEQYKQIQNTRVTLGVRPEDLSLKKSANSTQIEQTPAIELIEYMGDSMYVHFTINESNWILKTTPSPDLKSGNTVTCFLSTDKLYFFDTETGVRLRAE